MMDRFRHGTTINQHYLDGLIANGTNKHGMKINHYYLDGSIKKGTNERTNEDVIERTIAKGAN
jgi:hypothetical protein